MKRLPTFLIIGAGKSGTTSLYHYLNQHPQIFMSPVKEPHFFTYEGQSPPNPSIVTTFDEYRALFTGVQDEIAIGEASTSYLHHEQAPRRIAHYLPTIRMVAILRNPVERAYSNYLHNVRQGRETLTFGMAIQQEEQRIRDGSGYPFWYKEKGFYYRHLTRYFEIFDRSQLRIYLLEDLKREPQTLIADAFGFLGVDESFQPRMEQHNVSGLPRGQIGRLFAQVRKNPSAVAMAKRVFPEVIRKRVRGAFLIKPELPEDVKGLLIEEYRDDVLRLEKLLQRDLSFWLQ